MFLDRKLSVGAPFFNMAFTPFMVALGIVLPIGASLPWKRAGLGRVIWQYRYAGGLALAALGLGYAMQTGRSMIGPVGLFLGVWIVTGAMVDIWMRTGRGQPAARLARLRRLPRADWGKLAAHSGLAVTMLGIAGLSAWQQEDIRVAQLGQPFDVGGYTLTLVSVEDTKGANYFATVGQVRVTKDGQLVAVLRPEKRVYPVAKMPTTEAAIDYKFLRDIYVVLGDAQTQGGWAVRTYIKPLANWIWLGCAMMAFGGLLSLSDRRFRVAAGARKATREIPT
jgi:cytochrome c-type biogenesis protein CcmF